MDIIRILWRSVMGALVVSLVGLVSCGHNGEEDRLGFDRIDGLCDSVPEVAISMLDSIDYGSLTEKERHHYDLLRIKALDKAYVIHTSDSLIQDVIDYYSRHKDSHLWPVALYYGGRVYADLGDYPHALEYFQQAVDALPDTTENLSFRATVLSQTGRLLISLRLYGEALPYVEKAIEIDKDVKDTLNVIHDTQLLAGLYRRAYKYADAEKYFKDAYELSESKYPSLAAKSKMYIAQCRFQSGELETAIDLIRGTPDKVNPVIKNSALAYAAQMYYDAGYPDTAYTYARELISSERPAQKEIAYQVLLSPNVARYLPTDTLLEYVDQYRGILETMFDENENQMSISQQSLYNYDIQVRDRIKAERNRDLWKELVMAAVPLVLILCIVLMLMKIRNQRNLIRLHRALDLINDLKSRVETTNDRESKDGDKEIENKTGLLDFHGGNDTESLRNKLLEEVRKLNDSLGNKPIPAEILSSRAYNEIMTLANDGAMLKENDPLWKELEEAVLKSSPEFITRLLLLTRSKVSVMDVHIALLIKCGFRPVQITTLLSKSNGAIVSRRQNIGYRIFDVKVSIREVDGIIRSL